MYMTFSIELIDAKEGLLRIFRFLAGELEIRPYFKIRFRWWTPFDIDRFAVEFDGRYNISFRSVYEAEGRIEIFAEARREIRVIADTLYAFLSAYRAVLFQKEVTPLTERDVELEKTILKQYTHARNTPFI